MSVIENSLERLRRTQGANKTAAGPAPVAAPAVARPEPPAPLESPYAHKHFAIDFGRLFTEGYVPELGQERRFADYFHRIKRPLIARALTAGAAQDTRLIMLSGALPGDGKTFVALNLALSMARERDLSLLLIDGDLPKARITRVLGLLREPGLVGALRDERLDPESLVLDSDVPGLEFLPAGDALLTRRVKAKSARSAVVVRFSRARGRYERQGLLVETHILAEVQQQIEARRDA